MSLRKCGVILAIMCSCALVAPVAASAQSTSNPVSVSSFNAIPISGTAANGTTFTGHFRVSHFITRHGQTFAIGRVAGRLGSRFVHRTAAIPVSVTNSGQARDAQASCPVLSLTLGPLDLNLLGLKVHLNQVVLNITAQPGPGNLLGNLLCDVANLLNQNPLTGQLAQVLNVLQQILTSLQALGL